MCEILGEEKPGYLDGFVQTLGPVSFQVRLSGGRLVRHHQNQIRKRMDAALRPGGRIIALVRLANISVYEEHCKNQLVVLTTEWLP